jgi:hypothetical protein
MNDRIKQLLIQSEVFNKDGTVLKDVTGYELNKFALLIVRECAEISSFGHGSIDSELIKRGVLEHFGVEE